MFRQEARRWWQQVRHKAVRPAASLMTYPYPYVASGGKIGIHSVRPNQCLPFIANLQARGARFPVVKGVNDIDWLADVKQADPSIITIARLTSPDEGLQYIEIETDMAARAANLFAPILSKLAANPTLQNAVDFWEICNEPDPPGAVGYMKLAQCMIACMDRAAVEGVKLAVFALNAGTPEWDEITAMVETGVFGRARQDGHILTLHEGVFKNPETGTWTDPIDLWWPSLIPGSPYVPGAGALCFRYRYIYHQLQARNEVVPLVISELVYGGGYAQDGGSPADTVARAGWYDDQASQDYYLLAHLPFTLGPNAGEEWDDRDYEFAYPALIDYMESVRQRANAEPPTMPPPPPPSPPPAQQRIFLPVVVHDAIPLPEPGVVTANLLPQDATLAEKYYVATVTYGAGEGMGQSADDTITLVRAGQPGSQVKVWSVDRWAGDIVAYLQAAGLTVETRTLPPGLRLSQSSPPVAPLGPYITVTHLVPPDASLTAVEQVLAAAHEGRETVVLALAEALTLARQGAPGSRVIIWGPDRWPAKLPAQFERLGVQVEQRPLG